MLTIKNGKIIPIVGPNPIMGAIEKDPADIAATTDEFLPSGCMIGTSIFIIDKIDFCWCDGLNHWYREADKPVNAGQPISALF